MSLHLTSIYLHNSKQSSFIMYLLRYIVCFSMLRLIFKISLIQDILIKMSTQNMQIKWDCTIDTALQIMCFSLNFSISFLFF